MAKYIHYNKNLRCKIQYVKIHNFYRCQLQRRFWFILWADQWKYLTLKEGFWGEDWGISINPLRGDYQFGDYSEAWKTGTLDIKSRVAKMFEDFIELENCRKRTAHKLEVL